jgi:class I fructose-bisphosphate aldolase
MRRLLGDTGRGVFVAVDQAIPRGVAPRLASIESTLPAIVAGQPDAMTMHKGLATGLFAPYAGTVPLILKCSTFSTAYHPSYDAVVATVDEALRLGADAIAMGISTGSARQSDMFESLGALTAAASAAGLPVVCHSYPSGELIAEEERYAVEHVLHAARTAAELGADIIKTWYTGSPESFQEVVEGTPAVVMVAGGAKLPTDVAVLEMAAGAIAAGARGLTFGRNVWAAQDVTGMVAALGAVVRDGASPAEARELLRAQD